MDDALQGLVTRARADPQVLAVLLTGSSARDGMAGRYSDYDVYVVLDDRAAWGEVTHTPELDTIPVGIGELRTVPALNDDEWWYRWSFAYSRILLDRSHGEVAKLAHALATLSELEAATYLPGWLDAYVNFAYRAAKNARDGRHLEAQLDAAESIAPFLTTLFGLHHRMRPYNKYLRWELEQHPLGDPGWSVDELCPLLDAVLSHADQAVQRALFQRLEPSARAAGLSPVLDAWGPELDLVRGPA